MPQQIVHLVKLCVGCESVGQLGRWQEMRAGSDPGRSPSHVTRMWPKRADELVAGGSLYWVIKGAILARQKVIRLDEAIGEDGIRRCRIVLERELIRTQPTPRRAFQGWRYLAPEDVPPDLPAHRQGDDELPPELSGKLAEIGVL